MTNLRQIEKNTEYSIIMPDGKLQKFAYYGEKNGRLILLNTRYGTLTTMSASYFLKLIRKFRCKTRPYKVEYVEDFEQESVEVKKPTQIETPAKKPVTAPKKDDTDGKLEIIERWSMRLKTLPLDVEEKLQKDLKIHPRELARDLDLFNENKLPGPLKTLERFSRVKELLKGTPWDVN